MVKGCQNIYFGLMSILLFCPSCLPEDTGTIVSPSGAILSPVPYSETPSASPPTSHIPILTATNSQAPEIVVSYTETPIPPTTVVATEMENLYVEGKLDGVVELAFSSDSTALYSSSIHGKIYHWDLSSGEPVYIMENPDAQPSPRTSLSQQGWAAVIETHTFSNAATLLWNIASGEQVLSFEGDFSLVSVAVAPDGTMLVIGDRLGSIILWDLVLVERVAIKSQGETDIRAVAFSPDGNQFASGDELGNVNVYRAPSGSHLRWFRTARFVEKITFSSDGLWLAYIAGSGSVFIWDIETGNLVRLFETRRAFTSLASSPGDTHIAAGNTRGEILVWSIQTGELIDTIVAHNTPVKALAFSTDGLYLASGSEDGSIILDLWQR